MLARGGSGCSLSGTALNIRKSRLRLSSKARIAATLPHLTALKFNNKYVSPVAIVRSGPHCYQKIIWWETVFVAFLNKLVGTTKQLEAVYFSKLRD